MPDGGVNVARGAAKAEIAKDDANDEDLLSDKAQGQTKQYGKAQNKASLEWQPCFCVNYLYICKAGACTEQRLTHMEKFCFLFTPLDN